VPRKKGRRRLLKPPSPDISDGSVRYPFVAIVGRPNVGKSTLFNRLIGYRLAITEPTAGTTRDRIAALVHLEDGRTFELCDMGGLGGTGDPHDADVNRQIDMAMEYADVVLFLVDARDGLIPLDQTIARRVKKLGKPVVLVANKADTRDLEVQAAEFYQLGMGDLVYASAREGFGRHDVLDAIAKVLPEMPAAPPPPVEAPEDDEVEEIAHDERLEDDAPDERDTRGLDDEEGLHDTGLEPPLAAEDEEVEEDEVADEEIADEDEHDDDEGEGPRVVDATGPAPAETPAVEKLLRVAIVGRRNVGKSTWVNQLCGEERVIVSDKPGTTRDAVDVRTTIDGSPVVLIDTAGLRKRGKADDHIEIISHGRSIEAVRRCDAVMLVLDALERVGEVDKKLAQVIEAEHKPSVIVGNKWDLVGSRMTVDDWAAYIRMALPGLEHAPMVAISAKAGTHATAPVGVARELHAQSRVRVKTAALNRAITRAVQRRRPKPYQGRMGKVYFGTQIATAPVTVLLFVNEPMLFNAEWLRYLKNQLRRSTPWKEIPIKVVLRSRAALAKKSGGVARTLENMGALAERAHWIEDKPVENVKHVAELLDQDAVREVLHRTLGHDEDEDEAARLDEERGV
jgi:GTPase